MSLRQKQISARLGSMEDNPEGVKEYAKTLTVEELKGEIEIRTLPPEPPEWNEVFSETAEKNRKIVEILENELQERND